MEGKSLMKSAFGNIIQDLRYALRQLQRNPSFAITSVLTLALGIGATTAVFSVINAVLLQPLPFSNPDSIVVPNSISMQGYSQPPSYPSYKDMRAQNHTFAALAGVFPSRGINLESPAGPVALHAVKTTDNFFDVFGIPPLLGRTFSQGEEQPGRDDVAVLSHEVWQEDFGRDPQVAGKLVRLDGHPYTVIGVMPADFHYPLGMRSVIYTPLHAPDSWINNRGVHWLHIVGRLKPGVSLEQAGADMSRVFANIGSTYPDTDAGRKVQIHTLSATLSEKLISPLFALCVAVLAVLAISCVNIASLLLARGVKREREMAMRAAAGAGRRRLLSQVLTESVLLAAIGSVAGVLLALGLTLGFRTFLAEAMERGGEVHMSLAVLLVAVLLSSLTSVAATLIPALRLSRINPNEALRAGGNGGTSRAHHRIRSAFIVTQIALAMVLLFTSGLLLRSIAQSEHENVGFDPSHILVTELDLSPGRYHGRNVLATFYQPLLDRIREQPGVVAAGLVKGAPLQDNGSTSDVHIKGQPPYPKNAEMLAANQIVSPEYFDVFGIRLLRGRLLNPALDSLTGPASIVVNEAFVRKFFPDGSDPIGRYLDDGQTVIVGVVTDIKQTLGAKPMAEMDYLATQLPVEAQESALGSMQLVVRTQSAPESTYGELREALHQVDTTVPFRSPETMDQIIADQLTMKRLESWLFSIFAGLALLLAVVGLYGLMTHEVELGTREIGVRMALGATRRVVLRRILARTARMTIAGLVGGGLLALAAQRGIAALVPLAFGQSLGFFVGIACLLFAVSMMAAIIPARRAASIEPMKALRLE
jgi:putative ABC transport system permease protein